MLLMKTGRYKNARNKGTNTSQSDFVLSSGEKLDLKMTTTEKTYIEKQADFLESLMGEARGDICAALDISGNESH